MINAAYWFHQVQKKKVQTAPGYWKIAHYPVHMRYELAVVIIK